MQREPEKRIAQIGAYITLPFVLAVPPLLGAVMGRWLDRYLQTEPYFMYTFIILGFLAGVREFWRILKQFGEQDPHDP